MKCSCCKSTKIEKNFTSYTNTKYSICRNCGCHYQDPIIDFDYTSDAYWTNDIDPDGGIRNLSTERENKIKNWYGDVINFTNKYRNIDVLDFGCGLGFFLSALNNDIKKFGIEESKFANDFIKKNFPEINISRGGTDNLKILDKEFDIIMLYHVIEHVKDPSNLFDLLKKKLKKNGILILGTPLINTVISNFFGKNFRHYIPAHITIFNMKTLKNLFLKNSFKIIKINKPYFHTNYFTFENVMRLFNPNKISPPYRGSIVTIYGKLQD
jgi:2-polyprenyl-3-methyl-5-hydroxy-6-metoxy-1,4-benzoquinol methylase